MCVGLKRECSSQTWSTNPTLVEDVENFIADGWVKGIGPSFFIPEQSLQQSRELIDVQGVVSENAKKIKIKNKGFQRLKIFIIFCNSGPNIFYLHRDYNQAQPFFPTSFNMIASSKPAIVESTSQRFDRTHAFLVRKSVVYFDKY